jgi:pyruvate,water dikinase
VAALWEREISVRSVQAYIGVLSSAMRFTNYTGPVRQRLSRLVGPEDADALISNLSSESELLPSLGPLVGLAELARGKMTREDYVENYGHRGPNEWEVFQPRPAEESTWLDARLAEFSASQVEVDTLLIQQREKFRAAWQRLQGRLPQEANTVRKQLDEIGRRGRLREGVRSEIVRVISAMRAWARRAGELTCLGEGIFFLTVAEAPDVLRGDLSPISRIPARKQAYECYRALPPYPALIRGAFDPFRWAADPKRSSEIYDADSRAVSTGRPSAAITGSAGSAGLVEGVVRVALSLEEGQQLLPGEILVTPLTDIGWTPLFPRAAAIVTDTGAALSHAAIVARELGIPAVVGCGNATRQLRTGDRVRVNGTRGIVERVEPAPAADKDR